MTLIRDRDTSSQPNIQPAKPVNSMLSTVDCHCGIFKSQRRLTTVKKLLIIADLDGSSAVHNFLNHAIDSQTLPEGVSKLAPNSWIIDAHKSLPFLASLVTTAQRDGLQL